SEEQRKAYREKIEMNKIVRVTEIEITEAAFEKGRSIVRTLDSLSTDSAAREAYLAAYPGKIKFMTGLEESHHALERQIFQAYVSDTSGSYHDNVQNVRDDKGVVDSLLYSKPVTMAGHDQIVGVWHVWMSHRDVVLEISRKK